MLVPIRGTSDSNSNYPTNFPPQWMQTSQAENRIRASETEYAPCFVGVCSDWPASFIVTSASVSWDTSCTLFPFSEEMDVMSVSCSSTYSSLKYCFPQIEQNFDMPGACMVRNVRAQRTFKKTLVRNRTAMECRSYPNDGRLCTLPTLDSQTQCSCRRFRIARELTMCFRRHPPCFDRRSHGRFSSSLKHSCRL